MRTLAMATLLATTALLVPPSAASASGELVATINCDARTGIITTSVVGPLVQRGAPRPVTVEFERRRAVNVTATAVTPVVPPETPFQVVVRTRPDGSIRANGYTSSFAPETSLYYQETVGVTMKNAGGIELARRDATCRRDLRTTVEIDCDEVAGTVTATTTGRDALAGGNGAPGRPWEVRYRRVIVQQTAPDQPISRIGELDWTYTNRILTETNGNWQDTGYTDTPSVGEYHYYAEEVTVGVFNGWDQPVGGGFATCVLVDRSGTRF
jgi:hypothetical protein